MMSVGCIEGEKKKKKKKKRKKKKKKLLLLCLPFTVFIHHIRTPSVVVYEGDGVNTPNAFIRR